MFCFLLQGEDDNEKFKVLSEVPFGEHRACAG